MRWRIVRDAFAGYEVQVKRWWWPFWYQANGVNTHSTLDRAIAYAQRLEKYGSGKVVVADDRGKPPKPKKASRV